jgi:NAD(P)-dependent dehydrogenase (short-subunit alcohol dehydrogenase family)
MGIYVITGGSKGIGAETVRYLHGLGHDTVNIDWDGGDICVDIGTAEGRRQTIEAVGERCEDGIDGLILNAGIAMDHLEPSRVLSVNYFGTVRLAEGLFGLLKKKKGNCVVTVSNCVIPDAYAVRNKYYVDALLANCGDEARIGRLVDSFAPENAGSLYGSTKIALVRWLRRVAPSWAVRGVNLNAVAPGPVETAILPEMTDAGKSKAHFERNVMGLPMPAVYGEQRQMTPAEVGPALAMLVLPEAKGICGEVLFCDGGVSAILHSEKFY